MSRGSSSTAYKDAGGTFKVRLGSRMELSLKWHWRGTDVGLSDVNLIARCEWESVCLLNSIFPIMEFRLLGV